jgi:probable addiction module antidote protein
MKLKLRKFDASEYLDNEELVAEYLTAALEDANPEVFLSAIGDVAKARGMTAVAGSTGLGRESLYKAFAPGAKPRQAALRDCDQGPARLGCEAAGGRVTIRPVLDRLARRAEPCRSARQAYGLHGLEHFSPVNEP